MLKKIKIKDFESDNGSTRYYLGFEDEHDNDEHELVEEVNGDWDTYENLVQSHGGEQEIMGGGYSFDSYSMAEECLNKFLKTIEEK